MIVIVVLIVVVAVAVAVAVAAVWFSVTANDYFTIYCLSLKIII